MSRDYPLGNVIDSEAIEKLLEDAEDAAPEFEFVVSVRDFYKARGYVTVKQYRALLNVVNRQS